MASLRVHTLGKCPPVHVSSLELPAFTPFVHEVIKNTNVCMLFMPCDPLKFPTVLRSCWWPPLVSVSTMLREVLHHRPQYSRPETLVWQHELQQDVVHLAVSEKGVGVLLNVSEFSFKFLLEIILAFLQVIWVAACLFSNQSSDEVLSESLRHKLKI